MNNITINICKNHSKSSELIALDDRQIIPRDLKNINNKHGRVISPRSRGAFAVEKKLLEIWQLNEMEGGKNFPDFKSGPFVDPYGTDTVSAAPPADGSILSGGHTDNYRVSVNFTDKELENQIGARWPQILVAPGHIFHVEWHYAAPYKTRGYRWFITKDGWDESQRLTRDQFEKNPFFEELNIEKPYWHHPLKPKTGHEAKLPQGKKGHHVILLLWIFADTTNAFYQAFDVNFGL